MSTVNAGWRGPNIVKEGLVLYLDAASGTSYSPYTSGVTWRDISGNGNNGTLTNGPTYSSANGGSFTFDGTDDYVQNPNRSTITEFQYSSSFTVESFVKIMRNTGFGYVIDNRAMTDGNGNSYTGWGILQLGNVVQAFIGGYPGSFDWRTVNISTTQFSNNIFSKWAHIVWTNSPVEGESKIYVNGINVTSQSFDNNTPPYVINYNGNHRVTLGMSPADGNPGGHYISGSISVARLYNKTLSAQEVQQNYNALKSRFGL
jgi:hypothetical protein